MVDQAKPVETGGNLCVGFIKAVAVRCWALTNPSTTEPQQKYENCLCQGVDFQGLISYPIHIITYSLGGVEEVDAQLDAPAHHVLGGRVAPLLVQGPVERAHTLDYI